MRRVGRGLPQVPPPSPRRCGSSPLPPGEQRRCRLGAKSGGSGRGRDAGSGECGRAGRGRDPCGCGAALGDGRTGGRACPCVWLPRGCAGGRAGWVGSWSPPLRARSFPPAGAGARPVVYSHGQKASGFKPHRACPRTPLPRRAGQVGSHEVPKSLEGFGSGTCFFCLFPPPPAAAREVGLGERMPGATGHGLKAISKAAVTWGPWFFLFLNGFLPGVKVTKSVTWQMQGWGGAFFCFFFGFFCYRGKIFGVFHFLIANPTAKPAGQRFACPLG